MKVVTAEEMRQIDRTADSIGVTTEILMENAGRAVAEETKKFVGGVIIDLKKFHQDFAGTGGQFFGTGLQIDHKVAIGLAQKDHRRRGYHIQSHLLGGAGFHPGGAGDNLRADGQRY